MNYGQEKTISSNLEAPDSGEYVATGSSIVLRRKRLADAWDDYAWETDPELAYLDAAPVLTTAFSRYLADYDWELRNPRTSSRQLAVDTLDGRHMGNCSYYNISKFTSETELGIMIGDRNYWNKGCGTDIVTTLIRHIFNQTELKRIHLKTLESNIRAQKCFQKSGFKQYKLSIRSKFNFVLMEIHRSQWQEQQPGS